MCHVKYQNCCKSKNVGENTRGEGFFFGSKFVCHRIVQLHLILTRSCQGFQFEKKVPGGVIRVARALLRHDKGALRGRVQKRGNPLLEGVQGAYPGDAFWYIFSNKKCFLGGTVHLN